jgi:hypothetical protein
VLPLMGGRVGEWHLVRITTWKRAGCQAEKTKKPLVDEVSTKITTSNRGVSLLFYRKRVNTSRLTRSRLALLIYDRCMITAIDEMRSEESAVAFYAAEGVVVEGDAFDAAVEGEHLRLRFDLLGGEDPSYGRDQRVAVE